MTGYGASEAVLASGKLKVEIRSLNGKNADINLRSPLIPKDKELALRKRISEFTVRGTIDIFVTFEASEEAGARAVNYGVAGYYFNCMKEAARLNGLPLLDFGAGCPDRLMASIFQLPDVVEPRRQEPFGEEEWPLVEQAFEGALKALDEFRLKEGEILRKDLTSKVESILRASEAVESFEAERGAAIRSKILARFAEVPLEADPARLEQEMIFYLEKYDINEERVRLRQHCSYFMEVLDGDPYPGRKLGFIAQEMGREINTTGSKAGHSEIQRIVTSMKDELEKIKEQSLNIL